MPQLSKFLIPHIPAEQFGFLPGTGTMDAGLVIADEISRVLEDREEVRLIALDFKGAFDKVWWRGLLAHLWSVGLRSRAYRLFENYLSNRALVVVTNGGEQSKVMQIASGVPQGAIWSPILFDIFVRNVPHRVQNAMSIFYADDLTLIRRVHENGRSDAASEVEEDLERLYSFGQEWLLEFEVTKTQGLIISNKHDRNLKPPLKMGGVVVEEGDTLGVLGFSFDQKGNWSKHCGKVAQEARKRLGAIKRIQYYLDDIGILKAYKAFVRSRIEYGNLVYWGACESHLKKFDAIQESAKSMLQNKNLFLPSLETRRKAAAVGLCCKLMDGDARGELQNLKPHLIPNGQEGNRRSRRINKCSKHQYTFADQTKASSLKNFERSFRGRIPQILNELNDEVLFQQNISNFQEHRKNYKRK